MLEPKKIKFRKVHRGHRKGMAKGGTEVSFGSYGMKAMEPGWVTARQIEATRISISRREPGIISEFSLSILARANIDLV